MRLRDLPCEADRAPQLLRRGPPWFDVLRAHEDDPARVPAFDTSQEPAVDAAGGSDEQHEEPECADSYPPGHAHRSDVTPTGPSLFFQFGGSPAAAKARSSAAYA